MRCAALLLLLVSCGKPPPQDPLSWCSQPGVLEEFANRSAYPVSTREPILRGKPIVVNVGSPPCYEHTYLNRFPPELRPRSRDEVGTIIWVRNIRTPVAQYESGRTGYEETVELTLVDVGTKQAIWTNVFNGGKPPAEVKFRKSEVRGLNENGISGGYPTEAAIRWLLSLPRKEVLPGQRPGP